MIQKFQEQLELVQSFPTSGARAVAFFSTLSNDFLAVAQLAEDIPGGLVGMNEGNSDVNLVIWRAEHSQPFEEWQHLHVPGGEDVEYFSIDGRHFLATASIRSGRGPYNYSASSVIYELLSDTFVELQTIPTFGAKQWRYFSIGKRHFLALAQGLKIPGLNSSSPSDSTIFEWDGTAFKPFQTVNSAWGYNWLFFELSGMQYLAYADFREPSILMRWDGVRFVHFQTFAAKGGRAFCFFEAESKAYLALADIEGRSLLYQWIDQEFREHQDLTGPGAREFALVEREGETYLILVKFIQGSPKAPKTELESVIYRMENGYLKEDSCFTTHGATDVMAIPRGTETFLFVCESLTEDVRFRTDSKLYRFRPRNSSEQMSELRSAGEQSSEFLDLYTAYTASAQSIGSKLVSLMSQTTSSDPMLVATSGEMIFFPGDNREPSWINYRHNNRGFKELAAISHLGPALASLIQISTVDYRVWRREAENLLSKVSKAQNANSASLWRNKIRVEAFYGREETIAAMNEYACAATVKYLETVLQKPQYLTAEFLRKEYLEAEGTVLNATIPMNAVMIATFFLVGLDISYRMRIWLEHQRINWRRAMVLIVGRQGRETAGVTLSSNSVAQGIMQCSNLQLPVDRIYIAPHGPTVKFDGSETTESLRKYEPTFRSLWNRIYTTVGLGETMFSGYPHYTPQCGSRPIVSQSTIAISEMPQIRDPNDWLTLTTRMRMVLEDPRQLLSGCVTDYAAEQLRRENNDVAKVTVPGLDTYGYAHALAALVDLEVRAPMLRRRSIHEPHASLGVVSERFTHFLAPPKMCPVDDGEIAYYEEGEGDQVNIWVHGLPLDSRSWAAQRSFFATKYRNVYMDLRGYGNSTKFAEGDRDVTQLYCNDLLGLIHHLRLESVNLIGFASAGHVALRFGSQHPERLHKLVVLNASPCFRQRDGWKFGFDKQTIDKFMQAAEQGGIEALTAMVLNPAVVFKDVTADDGAKLEAQFREMSFNAGIDTVLRFFTDISFDDDRDLMPHIRTPTLLISGSNGEEVPGGAGVFLQQAIHNSRLVEIPGADHFLFATRADTVNPLIEGFLSA